MALTCKFLVKIEVKMKKKEEVNYMNHFITQCITYLNIWGVLQTHHLYYQPMTDYCEFRFLIGADLLLFTEFNIKIKGKPGKV